jgi:hypothetical protein
VLVLVELNLLVVNILLPRLNAPDVKVNAPVMVKFAPSVSASVEESRDAIEQAAVAAVVQVPVPDALSNTTVSVDIGTAMPGNPPVVKDQFVVLVLFQVPVPPTQK